MSQPANNFTANLDTMLPGATQPSYPTQTAPATRVDTAPQQASTAPGDGSVRDVHGKHKDLPSVPGHAPGTEHHAQGPAGEHHGTSENVPFKERVVGAAQKTRGTIFGDSELKEHGQAIIDGRTTFEEDRKH